MRIIQRLRNDTSLYVRYILVWIGIALTFFFAVFPEAISKYISFAHGNPDVTSKIFSGANAILLTVLAFVQESLRKRLAQPDHIGLLGKPLPHINSQQAIINSAPLDILLLFDHFPSFQNGPHIEKFLRRVAVLANFKPILIKNEDDITPFLKNRSVRGLVADKQLYEKVVLHIQKSHLTFFEIDAASTFASGGGGIRVTISIPEHSSDQHLVSKVAKILSYYHGPDTPRGIGFHGNWLGTYGIMSLKQDDDLHVEGRYWYASGSITGQCEIDDIDERLILHYDWYQYKSSGTTTTVGSNHFGKGTMVIPAGYDFFYGYWCPQEDQELSQGWSAARLCEDITHDILRGGYYEKDLGLHQHSKTELVDWRK